jgi:hypothetical protein
MADPKLITLTEEQFHQLLTAARPPAPPEPPSLDERHEQFVKAQQEDRPIHKEFAWGRVVSDETGASFVPRVVQSRGYPKGRVVELLDYQYPAGIDRHVNEGGLVPLGLPIANKSSTGDLAYTPQYKQWRYTDYWQSDLRRYVGRDAARLPPSVDSSKAAE